MKNQPKSAIEQLAEIKLQRFLWWQGFRKKAYKLWGQIVASAAIGCIFAAIIFLLGSFVWNIIKFIGDTNVDHATVHQLQNVINEQQGLIYGMDARISGLERKVDDLQPKPTNEYEGIFQFLYTNALPQIINRTNRFVPCCITNYIYGGTTNVNLNGTYIYEVR